MEIKLTGYFDFIDQVANSTVYIPSPPGSPLPK